MKKNKLALVLSIIAAILCFSSFIIKYVQSSKIDFPILLAGLFITALGISTYTKRKD